MAAEAFYRGAAAGLTPSNPTVGQLVSLPNGAAGKGIIAMADHDEKSLTSKIVRGHKVSWHLTGHYLAPVLERQSLGGGSGAPVIFNLELS